MGEGPASQVFVTGTPLSVTTDTRVGGDSVVAELGCAVIAVEAGLGRPGGALERRVRDAATHHEWNVYPLGSRLSAVTGSIGEDERVE